VSIALENDLTAYCIKAMGTRSWPFFLEHAQQFLTQRSKGKNTESRQEKLYAIAY